MVRVDLRGAGKKLKGAARHWASGGKGRSTRGAAAEALAAFGADPESINRATAALSDDDGHFPVWPENWQALELFLACADQWQWLAVPVAGGTRLVRQRLPNSDLLATMEMMAIEAADRPRLLRQVTIMREEAARVFSRES